MRWQPDRCISRRCERDPGCLAGQQERERGTRPYDPDDCQRHPADEDHRRLEPTEPVAFHTQVSREGA
jgi:hypothetical protein